MTLEVQAAYICRLRALQVKAQQIDVADAVSVEDLAERARLHLELRAE